MKSTSASSERLFRIRESLGNFPILCSRVRALMRRELFTRGIVKPEEFEDEVRHMAIDSQHLEGIENPLVEEPRDVWDLREERIRDTLTDLRFSQNLSYEIYERIVSEVLSTRGVPVENLSHTQNLELVPMELVFEEAEEIEALAPEQRSHLEARLQEAKVVLIRTMISDQLRYINIAREWFSISDLVEIRRHKIGAGRIGGKAAGMLLAGCILRKTFEEGFNDILRMPESYYFSSGELYTFMAINELSRWNNQKYKSEEQMRQEYPQIIRDFEGGRFPFDTMAKLRNMLNNIGQKPLIVRSSSLLEDNFGTSFAGKYDSIFLPNQGDIEQNLSALTRAMARIYASTLNPNALLYRRSKGLLDYDERMALLVQVVEGQRFGRYYFPFAAGVAFSRNLYRWSPQINCEDGFVRMVWGMGTRAVERVGNDHPRLVALSHPLLRPSSDPKSVRRYSQKFIDLIDLEDNQFKTLPVQDVLDFHYPDLRYIAQIDEEGYFTSISSNILQGSQTNLVLTFEEMLRRTTFADHMRNILTSLEKVYNFPVDMEFTMHLEKADGAAPKPVITILQCRPQSQMVPSGKAPLPTNIKTENTIFLTNFMVPEGYLDQIDYVVFVPAEEYFALPSQAKRFELGSVIGKLNSELSRDSYILVGPGRWGSSNPDLGVPVYYHDIYNSSALVEITGRGVGHEPEPSFGTHFFQDLMEAQIYPLAVDLNDQNSIFNHEFFYDAPSCLSDRLPVEKDMARCLRLIHITDVMPGHVLRIVMNIEKGRAVAYLTPDT